MKVRSYPQGTAVVCNKTPTEPSFLAARKWFNRLNPGRSMVNRVLVMKLIWGHSGIFSLTCLHKASVCRNTSYKNCLYKTGIYITSCPARRCLGIRYSHSAQLCRFAPLTLPSFLVSRLNTQPTNDHIEKLCSALNFCWLKKN